MNKSPLREARIWCGDGFSLAELQRESISCKRYNQPPHSPPTPRPPPLGSVTDDSFQLILLLLGSVTDTSLGDWRESLRVRGSL